MALTARTLTLVAASASIAISGCSGSDGDGDGDGDPGSRSQDPASLRGATFQVTAVSVARKPRPLVVDAPALIAFTLGGPQLVGRAGCGLFFSNGIRITPSKIILPFRIHPVPDHPPKCARVRRERDDWLKAFLASDPRWELTPPDWNLGDEREVALTLTSGDAVVELGQGRAQDLSGIPVPPTSGPPPATEYFGE